MDEDEIMKYVQQIEKACHKNEQIKDNIDLFKNEDSKRDIYSEILLLDNQRLKNILCENLETLNHSLIINHVDNIDTLPNILKQFIWLNTIKVHNTSISYIQNIPDTVKIVYIYNNSKFSIIDEKSCFPSSIERLSLNSNALVSVDFKYLSPNIEWLNLSSNHICIISNTDLLTKLEILQLQENKLQELPIISETIQKMDISCNKIEVIDWLPYSLTELDCSNNKLNTLFDCPPHLYKIFAYKNNITQIAQFPDTVTNLDLSQNKISILENLPKKLFELDINDNQIRDFNIEDIPTTLRILDISDNLIVGENIKHKLKSLKFIVNLLSDYKDDHNMRTSDNIDNIDNCDGDNGDDNINDIIRNFNQFNQFEDLERTQMWFPPNFQQQQQQQQQQQHNNPERDMVRHDGIVRV